MPDGPTVANSSCLIALDAVGQLDILERLYAQVDVPSAVAQEFGGTLPAWIRVQIVQNNALVHSLRLELGDGEAEAIALASEVGASRLILDDKKARRIARQLSLPVAGTLAVLLAAKDKGVISTVKEVIDKLTAVNFHLSNDLILEVLRRAGE